MGADLLPDCRSRYRRGSALGSNGETIVPVYCANCGKPWGRVAEKHITFAFVLCQTCADKHGDIAHTYQEPDTVFWERVANAQQEEYGEILSAGDLAKALDDPTSVLSKLAAEWRKRAEKEK